MCQSNFKSKGCGCSYLYNGRPCSEIVNFVSITKFRESCMEMEHDELDMCVMATLFAHRISKSTSCQESNRNRSHQEYYFQGNKVCRQTFCFAFHIGKKRLQAIAKSLDEHGFQPRIHGLCKKSPKNSLSVHNRLVVKNFITRYANENALPLPGRLPNYSSKTVLLLPLDKKIADIHSLYENGAEELRQRHVSLRTFRGIWLELCPHIAISKPTTDLCQKCQDYASKISNGGQLSEEEKNELLQNYRTQIDLAKQQRDIYREQTISSKQLHKTLGTTVQGNKPNSVDGTFHYSWDFAQVHYPHHSQQVGPIYFRTPRKCNVFGMCAEGSGQQTFYLIDEGEMAGKGADSVVSMSHHYFTYYGIGEKHAQVHFDNCCGQNKNNIVLWYGLWRVLTGKHESIQYSMMLAGHTKFSPDWHFGVWKVKWRDSNAETMQDIAKTVDLSSRSGHNLSQLVKDPHKPVIFYKWRKFLSQFFKPLKHITKYHQFLIHADEPGYVKCRLHANSEEFKFYLLKSRPSENDLPEVADLPGIEPARQWYLYEQIREFFRSKQAMNSVCPKPTVPKVMCKIESEQNWKSGTSGKRQKSLLN